jgi:hypothetical protein
MGKNQLSVISCQFTVVGIGDAEWYRGERRMIDDYALGFTPRELGCSSRNGCAWLAAEDLKRVVPSAYFFRGQSASVQLRNSAGFSNSSGKLLLVGLVDTSGYAADVQAKYQGFLITEVRVNVEGSDLPRGNTALVSQKLINFW